MDSMLYEIYRGYFTPGHWSMHEERVLKKRTTECKSQLETLLAKLDDVSRELWEAALEKQIRTHLEELPEMFSLGFSLGARTMIEILTS